MERKRRKERKEGEVESERARIANYVYLLSFKLGLVREDEIDSEFGG